MTGRIGDPSLYIKFLDGDTIWSIVVHADDTLLAGKEKFEQTTEKMTELFDSKPKVFDNFDFLGLRISTDAHIKFLFSQN